MNKLPEATPEQRETLHRKAIGKQHKETKVEYEVYLRHGDEEGEFYVDVRKDIVDSDGDVVNGGEYIEGEIFAGELTTGTGKTLQIQRSR